MNSRVSYNDKKLDSATSLLESDEQTHLCIPNFGQQTDDSWLPELDEADSTPPFERFLRNRIGSVDLLTSERARYGRTRIVQRVRLDIERERPATEVHTSFHQPCSTYCSRERIELTALTRLSRQRATICLCLSYPDDGQRPRLLPKVRERIRFDFLCIDTREEQERQW